MQKRLAEVALAESLIRRSKTSGAVVGSQLQSPQNPSRNCLLCAGPLPLFRRCFPACNQTKSPVGKDIAIPERVDEDDPSFGLDDIDDAKRHYIEKGYVVMRDVIPAAYCDQLLREFREKIKTYTGMIMRIVSQPETNAFDAHGFITNPIMNIHESSEARFNNYTDQTFKILTHQNVQLSPQ